MDLRETHRVGPRFGNHPGHGKTLACESDRILKQRLPWQLAETRVKLAPAVHGSGDSHAVDALLRHGVETLSDKNRRRETARRRARSIQASEFACRGVPMQDEQISAWSALHRFQHGKH